MNRTNIFWGSFIILIGALFALNNLGILDIRVWSLLWPATLIALGIWIIWATRPGRFEIEVEEIAIPLERAARAALRIRYGGGRLIVRDGATSGQLLQGRFAGGVESERSWDGNLVQLTLSSPSAASPVVFVPWLWGPRDWTIKLNRDVPFNLSVANGGSDTRLDLTDLGVVDLKIETGASTTDIDLPENAGYTRVRVSGGVTSLNIRVPGGVAARIGLKGGLRASTVDTERFPRQGDVYQSPEYESSQNRVEIEVDLGLGNVDIR